jgi:UDP-GlcNAc:undecaprenyl-phosphate GlcNAc-1-phosphate transferase
MRTYLTVYLGSTLLAIMTTAILIHVAGWLHLVDNPGVRKIHAKPIPRIGGVAIVISMIGLVIPVLLLPNFVGETFRLVQSKIITLLGAGGLMFVVGLVDDIRGLRVRTKFFVQLVAALIVCSAGIRIESIPVAASLSIRFGWFSWLFTVIWIIGITNAVNLSDGLDGLAAGISAIACHIPTLFNPSLFARNAPFEDVHRGGLFAGVRCSTLFLGSSR